MNMNRANRIGVHVTNRKFEFACVSMLLAAGTATAQNELKDPSFETSTLGSYTTVLNNFIGQQGVWGAENGLFTGPVGPIVPLNGTKMHGQNPSGGFGSQTVQVVDVSAWGFIPNSAATFTMSAFANTNNAVGATASIIARFYTGPNLASNIPGSDLSTGGVAIDGNPATWQKLSFSGAIPPTAKWMVFELLYQNATMGGVPGYWDEAKFTLQGVKALLGPGGTHVPIPFANPATCDLVCPTLTTVTGGFCGTWAFGSVPAAWAGGFTATGPSTVPGTTEYDFGSMPEGGLPCGSIITLGDLDGGSGSGEGVTFKAFDAAGAQITTSWLDRPYCVQGTSSPTDTPGWTYAAGVYAFSGNTVPGNPSVGVRMETNTRIARLEAVKTGTNWAMSICAPKPPCYADCDGDGVLSIDDFICFQTFFALGC